MESCDFVERISWSDRVNEQESFSSSHILFTHRSVNRRNYPIRAFSFESSNHRKLTSIPLDLQYPIHLTAQLLHRSCIVFGTNLCKNKDWLVGESLWVRFRQIRRVLRVLLFANQARCNVVSKSVQFDEWSTSLLAPSCYRPFLFPENISDRIPTQSPIASPFLHLFQQQLSSVDIARDFTSSLRKLSGCFWDEKKVN